MAYYAVPMSGRRSQPSGNHMIERWHGRSHAPQPTDGLVVEIGVTDAAMSASCGDGRRQLTWRRKKTIADRYHAGPPR
jgi:hypothetical protein